MDKPMTTYPARLTARHPEMDDSPHVVKAETVTTLAVACGGVLNDALDTARRILGRLEGSGQITNKSADLDPALPCVLAALTENREHASMLHKMLCEIENRIGG